MKLKERLINTIRLYFMLVTLITVLLIVLGLALDSDRVFGYEAFFSPLIYATISVVPCFFLNTSRELSIPALLIRRGVTLAIIEAVILTLAFNAKSIPTENPAVVIGIAGGIVVVYVLACVFEYIFERSQAARLTQDLERYQSVHR